MLKVRHYKYLNEIKTVGNDLELEMVALNFIKELERRVNLRKNTHATPVNFLPKIQSNGFDYLFSINDDRGCL